MFTVFLNATDEQWTSPIFYLFLFVMRDLYINLRKVQVKARNIYSLI
jgi:hypothetical protein